MAQPLIVHPNGLTLELTLNRPGSRNALARALVMELLNTLHRAAGDANVRTVLITGAPPAFCAGLDLRELREAAPADTERDLAALHDLYETIIGLDQPVIAAVNGPAVAGGAALVTACDLGIFARSATLGYPQIRHGLVAPLVMPYLARLVGERRAKHLLLTGESVPADVARDWGLCTEVVDDAYLLLRARHYAGLFASYPAAVLAETKRRLNELCRPGGPPVGNSPASPTTLHVSKETQAGIDRFLDA